MGCLIDSETKVHHIKVMVMGENTEGLYNKLKSNDEIECVKENASDINIWENVDVGIIIAYAIENSFASDSVNRKFVHLVKCAKDSAKFTLPILVSESLSKDNVLIIKPSEFQNEEIDYYVYKTVMSIVDILSPSIISIDIADLRNLFIINNKTKFTYGNSNEDCAITAATNIAINRLNNDIHDIKGILFNVIASENKLNMDEIKKSSDIINNYYKDANVIWGAEINNELEDNVRVSIWLFCDNGKTKK